LRESYASIIAAVSGLKYAPEALSLSGTGARRSQWGTHRWVLPTRGRRSSMHQSSWSYLQTRHTAPHL